MISPEQAADFLELRPLMEENAAEYINFYWSYYRLVINSRREPIRWEESKDPLRRKMAALRL